jgi:hypothetical protein
MAALEITDELFERDRATVPGQRAGETSSVPTESREESEVADLQCVGRTAAGAAR